MGTFTDYHTDLEHFAAEYAEPVNRRLPLLSDPEEFVALYIDGFVTRFSRIQLEYRKRKRAFDTLFKHRPRDEAGSFAYRWECVLDRLRRAEPQSWVIWSAAISAPRDRRTPAMFVLARWVEVCWPECDVQHCSSGKQLHMLASNFRLNVFLPIANVV